MSHTPGPWFATFENYRWVIECQGEFGPKKALAVTAGFYPKHEANARLIAAAPQLLEALEHIAASLYYNDYGDPALLDSFDESIIDAAIRAAKGEA